MEDPTNQEWLDAHGFMTIAEEDPYKAVVTIYRFMNRVYEKSPEQIKRYSELGLSICGLHKERLQELMQEHYRFVENLFQLSLFRLENGINPVTENRRVYEFLKRTIIPPPNTTNNYEINIINLANITHTTDILEESVIPNVVYASQELSEDKRRTLIFDRIRDVSSEETLRFGQGWKKSGFARIEMSHKFAAALALTDTSGEINSPWGFWSIIIPPDLIDIKFGSNEVEKFKTDSGNEVSVMMREVKPERIWCEGIEPIHIVGSGTNAVGVIPVFTQPKKVQQVLKNLVRGICLFANNQPKHGSWGTSKDSRGKPTKLASDIAGDKYVIGKPVSIDLRDTLREFVSGKTRDGGSPTVQFLVRGHMRNQAYGPGHGLHRPKWIEPYWKGNEEMRTLLKGYKIQSDDPGNV